MAIDFDLTRMLRSLALLKHRVFVRRLNQEEVSLIDHFRTLPERDRVAVRYMCTAIRQAGGHRAGGS